MIGLVGKVTSGAFQLMTTSTQVRNDQPTTSETHTVTSYNQSGGITAHTVNAFPESRRLNNEKCDSLSIKIYPYADRPILIDTVVNDREAMVFAKDTENCLHGKGFEVEGIQKTMYELPPEGQDVRIFKDKVLVKIGVAMTLPRKTGQLPGRVSGWYNHGKEDPWQPRSGLQRNRLSRC